MKNADIQTILADLAEEAIPSESIDLWKKIQPRLDTSESGQEKRNTSMKTTSTRTYVPLRVTLAVTGIVIAVVLLLATPQGRAWAQDIIRFFTRLTTDSILAPTSEPVIWVDITPGITPPSPTPRAGFMDCGDFTNPICSIEQIRSKVGFPVKELGSIPQGLAFIGATGDPGRVFLLYRNDLQTYGILLIEEPYRADSELLQWEVGASATVETVQIGNVTGEYVKGAFVNMQGEPERNWDQNIGMHTLHWVDEDIFYDLQAYGPDVLLDREKMVILAEGLITELVSVLSTPIPVTPTLSISLYQGDLYSLGVPQVEEQAGFSVQEPTHLPEFLFFAGSTYDAKHNLVRLLYRLDPNLVGEDVLGLRVSLQPFPDAGECALCGMVTGEFFGIEMASSGMTVGKDAVIETVKVGETSGQYVQGFWAKTNDGWVWMSDNIVMTLRWQENGWAYELQYTGLPITKADLISIAESIK